MVPFTGQEQLQYKLDEVLEAEALLLGRVTYEGFAEAWPPRSDEAGFADKMNAMPKYVASTTLTELEGNNSTLLEGTSPRGCGAQAGGGRAHLVKGSAKLIQTLVEHDLVDECRLMVFPVVLGSGKRLFPNDIADKRTLRARRDDPVPDRRGRPPLPAGGLAKSGLTKPGSKG